jgi:hypothetical protein
LPSPYGREEFQPWSETENTNGASVLYRYLVAMLLELSEAVDGKVVV